MADEKFSLSWGFLELNSHFRAEIDEWIMLMNKINFSLCSQYIKNPHYM